MTHDDKQSSVTEHLFERIRKEIIPLFDKLIAGEKTYHFKM